MQFPACSGGKVVPGKNVGVSSAKMLTMSEARKCSKRHASNWREGRRTGHENADSV